MKRRHFIVLFVFAAMAMALSWSCVAEAGIDLFAMPGSLREIGAEAFLNSAPGIVYLPESVEYIGDRAFAGISGLRLICVPEATRYIGEDAFAGANGLVIVGKAGSYAGDWAREHGYRFINQDVWLAAQGIENLLRQLLRYPFGSEQQGTGQGGPRLSLGDIIAPMLPAPKDRPEMHPIDYNFP